MFTVVKYCIESQIHPLEDLTYVGSGSVIKKEKEKISNLVGHHILWSPILVFM